MNTPKKVRFVLYSFIGIGAVLASGVLGGCSTSGATDGKAKWFVGMGYEQERKEHFTANWGSSAYGGGAQKSHNPWGADEARARNSGGSGFGSGPSPAVRK